MLLKNYYTLLKQSLYSHKTGTGAPDILIDDLITRSNGSQISCSSGGTAVYYGVQVFDNLHKVPQSVNGVYTNIPSISTLPPDFRYVVFGDSNTEPTIDDYSIKGNIIPNLKCTALTVYEISNGVRVGYTFINNNTTDVEISEVCIFDNFAYTGNAYKIALWREVFAQPIVVGAGESFTYNFDYTIEV